MIRARSILFLNHDPTIKKTRYQVYDPNSIPTQATSFSLILYSFSRLDSSFRSFTHLIMSTTTTTTAAATTSSCHAKLYDIPTHDAACALPIAKSNASSVMSDCCSSASVVEYDGCDYYCLAQGQTVGTLAECLIKAVGAGEFWCNTNANATATATATATGTGVVTLGATTTGADSTASGTSSGSTATSTSTSGAGVSRPRPVSKSALGMVGVLLIGSMIGLSV